MRVQLRRGRGHALLLPLASAARLRHGLLRRLRVAATLRAAALLTAAAALTAVAAAPAAFPARTAAAAAVTTTALATTIAATITAAGPAVSAPSTSAAAAATLSSGLRTCRVGELQLGLGLQHGWGSCHSSCLRPKLELGTCGVFRQLQPHDEQLQGPLLSLPYKLRAPHVRPRR